MLNHNPIANKAIGRMTLLLSLPLLHAGCAVPVDGQAEEGGEAGNLAASSEALTNGDVSADPPYVVEVRVDASGSQFGGFCTGSVISQHYVLTAAHCFGRSGVRSIALQNGAHAEITAYSGNANVEIHPNFVNGAVWTNNVPWDIALVRLEGAGLGSRCLSFLCRANVPRVRIYAGPETPWTTRGGMFSVTGYGRGTDPGGSFDCPNQSATDGAHTKRGGTFAFSGSGVHDGTTWFSVDGYASIRTLCPGDSGSGWRLSRNGEDFLFAIWSGGYFVHDGTLSATMVQAKMAWIQARSSDTLGLPLVCTLVRDHRQVQEVDFYDCQEQPVIVASPGL
jgi:hypothetical protein